MRLAYFFALLFPATSLRLENNAYTGLIVAIKSDIPEDSDLVETIKKVFTDASEYLYKTSKKRAYFGEITIVLPEAWKMKAEAATAAETFSRAHVRINPPEIFFGIESNAAYVESTALCGGEGLYMHVTPKRISDPALTRGSPPHRMIVHEWAHLRWGVYDEYYQSFYGLDDDGRAGRCPQKVERCLVTATPVSGRWRYSLNTVSGSVMWKQYYNQVENFCDDSDDPNTRHYRTSNTAQNRFCNMQSVWEVMRQSPDFTNDGNPPRDVKSTVPTFRIVKKSTSPVICLVLDISNSMINKNRITKLRQAAKNYINNVASGTKVGIVNFDSQAQIVQEPIAVTDQASRDELGSKLPNIKDISLTSRGQTNLTNGLLKGIETVAMTSNMNREIVFVSDGMSNQPPYLTDSEVVKIIQNSQVQIHTIGIGAADTNLPKISDISGGMAFADLESPSQPAAMQEAFGELFAGSEISYDTKHLISTGMLEVPQGMTVKHEFCVDDGVGRDTEVNVYYGEYSYKKLRIKVSAPSCPQNPKPGVTCGATFKSKDGTIRCDDSYRMCSLNIPMALSGTWLLSVYNSHAFDVTVSYTVTSKQANPDALAVSLETFLSKKTVTLTANPPPTITITALLLRGSLAVANATVIAVISRPSGDSANIYLWDNGAGPDLFAEDGLYSGTFTGFTMSGSYNVKVIATNDYGTNMDMSSMYDSSKKMERLVKTRKASLKSRRVRDDSDFVTDFDNENAQILSEDFVPPPLSKFMRVKSAGMFSVEMEGMRATADMYGPSRIMDLNGSPKFEGSRVITLTWTAVGDDMESGTASSYSVRVSKNFDDLMDNFSAQRQVDSKMLRRPRTTDLNAPAMANLQEILSFQSPFKNAETVYAAVRTVDDSGRMSALSNIVAVQMKGMCFCPKRDLCAHPYVILGRVLSVDKSSTPPVATFSVDTKILKPAVFLFSPPPVVDNLSRSGQACDCPSRLEEGKVYLLTASFSRDEIRLEVANENYIEEVPGGMVQKVLKSTEKLLESC